MPFLRCLPCFTTHRGHTDLKPEPHPTPDLKPKHEDIPLVVQEAAATADINHQPVGIQDLKSGPDRAPELKHEHEDIPQPKEKGRAIQRLKQKFVDIPAIKHERDSLPETVHDGHDLPNLKAWAASFLKQVIAQGFEATFRDRFGTFANFAESHPEDLIEHIETWLRADKSIKQHLPDHISSPLPANVEPLSQRRPGKPIPGVDERDAKPVKVFYKEVFTNCTGTVQNVPRYTFVPKTKIGVINIVKFARSENLRVRVAGGRHSSSEIYGSSDEVLISMRDLDTTVAKSRFLFSERNPQESELQRIQFEGTITSDGGTQQAKVRLGAAVTSEHFRRWALNAREGGWAWMLWALPILSATTSGGWTQALCHGNGISHGTISDLVLEVVIVNCRGELQVIRDKEMLKAVSGCFGLMGVVVEQVFVLDPLKIVEAFPRKVTTALGVPPTAKADVPRNDDFDISVSDSQLEEARRAFERDCKKFYAEWLWFPFQPEVWINTWDTNPVTKDRPVYPDKKDIKLQRLHSAMARIFEVSLLRLLPAKKQSELMGFALMQTLPAGHTFKASIPDALHLRQGFHLQPVRQCEIEIELPPRNDGTSDFSICQKAWWMAITVVYKCLPAAPMRTTLVMRITGGSNVTMSTQRGNDYGTCSIEVLTNSVVDDSEWAAFIEKVTDRWAKLRNPMSGVPLRVRPHFAKEWPRRIKGMKIDKYLKAAYMNEIREFRDQLRMTAELGEYELVDAFKIFGNDTILDLVNS